jgi:hypothetical protein
VVAQRERRTGAAQRERVTAVCEGGESQDVGGGALSGERKGMLWCARQEVRQIIGRKANTAGEGATALTKSQHYES